MSELKPIEKRLLPDIRKHLPRRVARYLNEDQIKELEENLDLLSKGDVSTIQMTCKGHKFCPYKDSCPFKEPPVGHPCPLETAYQEKWLEDYLVSFGLEPGNKAHISLVAGLVTTEIELMRARAQMSSEEFITYIQAYDRDVGERISIPKLNTYQELIDALEKRRLAYLKELTKLSETLGGSTNVLDPRRLLEKIKGEAGGGK